MHFLLLTISLICLLNQAGWANASESAGVSEKIKAGDDFINEDQFDRAIALYHQAVEFAPHSAEAHQRLGKALSLSGDLRSAEYEMRTAIKLDPKNSLAHSNLGMILGMQKRYAECALEEKTAIELDPDDAFAYRALGSALGSLGYYDQSISAFQKALALEPGNVNAYINFGAVLGRKGDFENAIVAYRDALAVKPNSVAARLGLGAALGKIGNLKGQIKEYRQAVELAPDNDNAHGRLGWALYRAGSWQEALHEGYVTNWLRLQAHGQEYLRFFLSFWAAIFMLFGFLFAVLFLGSRFKPEADEQVIKSYFLTFHKDKPGRFVITNKRLVFVPEAFSRWFGSSEVSVPISDIEAIESNVTGDGGILTLELRDGPSLQFRVPHLILKPLLEALSDPARPVNTAN